VPAATVNWLREQAAFAAVLVVLAAGFVYLLFVPDRWGRASGIIAVAALLAAVLRAGMPTGRVGWLAVRSRAVDAGCYLVAGGLLLAVDIRLHG
jgi:protein-S-isoprenylcysteine O-methyltransferase Ste14